MAQNVPLHISCPASLIKEIDEYVGEESRKRSEYFVKAAREKLERDKQKDALKKSEDKWIQETLIPAVRTAVNGQDFHTVMQYVENQKRREFFKKKLSEQGVSNVPEESLNVALFGVLGEL